MFFHLFLLKNEASQWRKEFWLITIRWFKKMKKGAIHYHCSDILFLTARLVCSSSTKCVFKVQIFWKATKFETIFHLTFLSSVKKKWKIVSNLCGLFMSVLYTSRLKKQNVLNINAWCWIYLFIYILEQQCSYKDKLGLAVLDSIYFQSYFHVIGLITIRWFKKKTLLSMITVVPFFKKNLKVIAHNGQTEFNFSFHCAILLPPHKLLAVD